MRRQQQYRRKNTHYQHLVVHRPLHCWFMPYTHVRFAGSGQLHNVPAGIVREHAITHEKKHRYLQMKLPLYPSRHVRGHRIPMSRLFVWKEGHVSMFVQGKIHSLQIVGEILRERKICLSGVTKLVGKYIFGMGFILPHLYRVCRIWWTGPWS